MGPWDPRLAAAALQVRCTATQAPVSGTRAKDSSPFQSSLRQRWRIGLGVSCSLEGRNVLLKFSAWIFVVQARINCFAASTILGVSGRSHDIIPAAPGPGTSGNAMRRVLTPGRA